MEGRNARNFLNVRYWSCCNLFRILVLAGFVLVLYQAFRLQIIEHGAWVERERAQTAGSLEIQNYRGSIYDARGRLLAFSVPQYSLFADGEQVENPKKVAASLAALLDEPQSVLEKKLARGRRFIWIKRHLTDAQALAVESNKSKGLYLTTEYKRFYPYRQLAGQVLGFVGLDGNGLEGVEKGCDRVLRKDATVAEQFRDGFRRGVWLRSSLPPEPDEGHGVRLNLDAFLQYVCESELEKAVVKYKARAGEVVLFDPRTFAVLAMANWPYFDPNLCDRKSADAWRNRTITDSFEPGSTFKVFLVAAALQEGTVKVGERIYCENGKCRLAGHTINDVHPYGWLTIPEVVKYSSNIAASKLAMQLGSERYYRYIQGFGFGSVTGIDLPGEVKGLLRPWKRWRPIDLATTGFGQSIGVTALQLTHAVACIANGGLSLRPRVVKEIVGPQGEVAEQRGADSWQRVITERTAAQIRDMMKLVTEEGGTGVQAAPEGFTAAGKTGTAQVVDPATGRYASRRYTALFTGFTPAEEPRLAMTIVIHEPQGAIYGGVVAAPVFRGIAARALPYLGVSPSLEDKNPSPPGLRVLNAASEERGRTPALGEMDARTGVMPDVTGMSLKMALLRLAPLGVQTKFQGSGRVVTQYPPQGTPLDSGTVVELALNENR